MMGHQDLPQAALLVAENTAGAVHRRDHSHGGDTCHPHVVEVVGLGWRGLVVCHDCDLDSGFTELHQATHLAEEHRELTA